MVDSHRLEGNKNKKVPFSRRERARVERPRSGRVKTLKEASHHSVLKLSLEWSFLMKSERRYEAQSPRNIYIYNHRSNYYFPFPPLHFPFFLFDHPLPSLLLGLFLTRARENASETCDYPALKPFSAAPNCTRPRVARGISCLLPALKFEQDRRTRFKLQKEIHNR